MTRRIVLAFMLVAVLLAAGGTWMTGPSDQVAAGPMIEPNGQQIVLAAGPMIEPSGQQIT